jgi:serpin B
MKGVIIGSYVFIVALLIVSIMVSGCVSDNKPKILNDANFNQNAFDSLVKGNNEFGFKLYSQLSKTDNQFFSPYSITFAFGVLGEASNGKTKEELDNLFGYPSLELRKTSFANFYNIINNNSSEYKLNTVNALWVNNNFSLLQEYVNTVEQYYGAKLDNIDFSDAEKASDIINKWVEDQTNNKIQDIISKDFISAETRIVIANAIYFKGKWDIAFKEKYTEEKDFTNDSGKVSKVNMMQLFEERFRYYDDNYLQAIELPYKGNDLSMIVVLPRKDLNSLIGFDNNYFNTIIDGLGNETVDLYLPKFKLEVTYNNLKDNLGQLGLKEVFTDKADLSGFTGERNLYVSDVIHKAFVEVNEEGTEAAAATVIGVKMTSSIELPEEPKVFNANHPFMFYIIDNKTKTILFFGSIVEPKE